MFSNLSSIIPIIALAGLSLAELRIEDDWRGAIIPIIVAGAIVFREVMAGFKLRAEAKKTDAERDEIIDRMSQE